MTKVATITSKKQLTIPAELYRRANFVEHQKVLISEIDGKLIITPTNKVINNLAGSLKMPKKWQDKDTDQIIAESKKEYFINKK